MRFLLTSKLWPIAAVIATLLVITGPTFAHERRDVGKYQFVVGWITEPAFESQMTGVYLRVREAEPGKSPEDWKPVEGLEKTLQVEITHVTSGTSKVFKLRSISRDLGHYTNDLVLTASGQYRFRFFGDIVGTPVNETFVSGSGRFDDVEPSAELQFPEKLPQVREVAAAARGAQNASQRAQDKASSASTLAVGGIVLGIVGIALAATTSVVAWRRK